MLRVLKSVQVHYSSCYWFVYTELKPATHVTETGTMNWYQSSGTRNLHVCRSIWYHIFLVPDSGTE